MEKNRKPSVERDYQFFKEAVGIFSSSLLLPDVMRLTFDFFKKHFPIEGLSLNRFDIKRKAMHILFLVTGKGFHSIDSIFQMPEKAILAILELEKTAKIINDKGTVKYVPTAAHSKAVSNYLTIKDRARLNAILSTPKQDVGHFSLIGVDTNCFDKQHEHKLEVLWPILGLVMRNLLQYHEISELQNQLTERNHYLSGRLRDLDNRIVVGEDGGLRKVKEMVNQLVGQDIPVLITGETGTGKELIADAVQRVSARHQEPYIKVNCGAIPETLIDTELFGHEKGAFTGADRIRYGRFEQAKGGTLFLDEIGDMPFNVQVRLLRVLQDGYFERIGSNAKPILSNVRIIAATNKNLLQQVADGKFREDLYYRLNVYPIHIPPLRERAQDIPMLVNHFVTRKARQMSLDHRTQLAKESLPALMSYQWPGNVRELENLVERAMAVDPQGPLQLDRYLPVKISSEDSADKISIGDVGSESNPAKTVFSKGFPNSIFTARELMPTLDQVMAGYIRQALMLCNGQVGGAKGAAKLLDINANTLRKRMDKLKILYGRNA